MERGSSPGDLFVPQEPLGTSLYPRSLLGHCTNWSEPALVPPLRPAHSLGSSLCPCSKSGAFQSSVTLLPHPPPQHTHSFIFSGTSPHALLPSQIALAAHKFSRLGLHVVSDFHPIQPPLHLLLTSLTFPFQEGSEH